MLIIRGRKPERITMILEICENSTAMSARIKIVYFDDDSAICEKSDFVELSGALFALGQYDEGFKRHGLEQRDHKASPKEGEAGIGGSRLWTYKFFYELSESAKKQTQRAAN